MNIIENINNQLNIFYTTYELINFQAFEEKKLLAIAGIGNPNNFFNLLLEKKLKVEKKIIFPDHYKPKLKFEKKNEFIEKIMKIYD